MTGLPYSDKTLDVLRALRHLKKQQRSKILRGAHKELIKCICEIVLNLLHGNIDVTTEQKNKLKRHRQLLRQIGAKTGSWSKKKKIIVQSGGGFLIPLLAPIIGSLLASFIDGTR